MSYHHYGRKRRRHRKNPIQAAFVLTCLTIAIILAFLVALGCQSHVVNERNWKTLENVEDTLAEGANTGKGLTPAECADTAEVMGAAMDDSPTVFNQVKVGIDTAGGLLPAPWGMILTTVSGLVTVAGGYAAKRRVWDIPNEITKAEEVAEIDPTLGKVGSINYDDPKTKAFFKRQLSAAAFHKLYPHG